MMRNTPPGLVPPAPGLQHNFLPPHLRNRSPFDNPADSMSLFSMGGGFPGHSRLAAANAAKQPTHNTTGQSSSRHVYLIVQCTECDFHPLSFRYR